MRFAQFVPGLFFLAVLSCAAPQGHGSGPYDLILRGGRIVDGTGNPWYVGDVAVRGEYIVAIGTIPEGASARRVIDVRGLVVAPGFIDMHSHSERTIFADGDAHSKIRQGVTTDVLGEHTSGGPNTGKLRPKRITIRGETVEVRTLGDYYDALEKSGTAINMASYVSQGNIWRCVMGDSHERPTPGQLDEMKALIAEAMEDGAWGMSIMVAAPPGMLATTEDLVALSKVVGRYGGIYSTHIRNEGTEVLSAIKEAIEVGEKAGVGVDVIHIKIADQKFWGHMNEIVALIDAARARGVNVQANVYPYTRGNNNLLSIVPPWAHEGGNAKFLERLRDPKQRVRMKKDINGGIDGWYNHYTAVGKDWSRMLVNADLSAKNKRFEGMTMDKILAERTRGKTPMPDLLDEMFDFLIEENGSISTIYAHHTEKDRNLAMVQPWCSIGSDGSAYATRGPTRKGKPHPRNFGTFPRVLGKFVREDKVLSLEDAVRKMTSLNANKLGLRDRGVLRRWNVADITVFDPGRVIDKATYLDPFQYNEGIEYVMVNGTLVLDRGKHTGARPGRSLRKGK